MSEFDGTPYCYVSSFSNCQDKKLSTLASRISDKFWSSSIFYSEEACLQKNIRNISKFYFILRQNRKKKSKIQVLEMKTFCLESKSQMEC